MTIRIYALLVVALLAQTFPAHAAAAPQRIVSLNICTDELLLRLVDPSRISSVTWLARDPRASNVAQLAARVPVNYGLAEEVVPAAPDLVLAGRYTARQAVGMLKQTGFRVVAFDVPNSIAEVRSQILEAGRLLDAQAKAEQLVAGIDRKLAAAGTPSKPWPGAIILNPTGYTVGPGTLADEVMRRAGLDNIVAHMNVPNYTELPLETLLRSAPDVLIVNDDPGGAPSLSTDLLRHPILKALAARTRIVTLPSRLWSCPGPGVADAVARLKAVADEVRLQKAGQ